MPLDIMCRMVAMAALVWNVILEPLHMRTVTIARLGFTACQVTAPRCGLLCRWQILPNAPTRECCEAMSCGPLEAGATLYTDDLHG